MNRGAEARECAAILRERARELARREEGEEPGAILHYVEFVVGRSRFAVPVDCVSSVITPAGIFPVPRTPPFVAGVVNIRGSIVSVVDLREVLGMHRGEEVLPSVVVLAGGDMEFGLLAERVEGAKELPERFVEEAPAALGEGVAAYVAGILPGGVTLLDAAAMLQSPAMRVDGQ
ncbi:MAG TPA: chemotaxis protein CheW [Verrucomicrobiae bacterium]|nr:chemotaxis protein CheW [Verrucomicrobiae bacterium]